MNYDAETMPHEPRALPQIRPDARAYFTPAEIASRWDWHVESVRRAIRQRRLASVILSRRRLVPVGEIHRIEAAGFVAHLN